jgi:putative tryptophan/tyrosine transport system substrate-binding protein
MDRRAFIGVLALGPLAVRRVALAQPAQKLHRIGILGSRSPTSEIAGPQPRDPYVSAVLRGLRELGYVYGQHFVTEARGPDGKFERLPSLAAELVGLEVDVIVAPGPSVFALKQATSTIPVVMAGAADPDSADLTEIFGRAAVFVDKILKGAKPGELPIEQPTKFDFVINLKAARSIGLTIPQVILTRANEVIQ